MKKPYYECHITMLGSSWHVKPAVEKIGWAFSCIDSDIDLGAGIKCYATKQFNADKFTKEQVVKFVEEAADALQAASNFKIMRRKVELVVYDVRTK